MFDLDSTRLVRTTRIGSGVSVLDARSGVVLRTVPLPYDPRVFTVDERTAHVFVAGGSMVSMLDARRSRLLHTGITIDSPESLAVGDRHRHYDRVDAARARPNPRRTAGVWCILRT